MAAFDLEPAVEKLGGFGQSGDAEAEGALDDASLAADVASEIEGLAPPNKG